MTPKEVDLRYYGILLKRIEEKRNIRSLIYAVHCHAVEEKNRLDVWDLMPLNGDPTPAMRKKLKEKDKLNKAKDIIKQVNKFKKQGLIK